MSDSFSIWINLLPWWYSSVPAILAKNTRLVFATVTDFFSFEILLRTLFQPWKRDTISTQNLSLQERFQVWSLNGVSRLFGAIIRGGTIVVGLIALLFLVQFFIVIWLLWVVAPLLGVGLITLGLVTLMGGLR